MGTRYNRLGEAVLTSTHNIFYHNIDRGTRYNRLDEAVLMSITLYVLSRNKKNNVYPCKPQFYFIKVGFKGVKII